MSPFALSLSSHLLSFYAFFFFYAHLRLHCFFFSYFFNDFSPFILWVPYSFFIFVACLMLCLLCSRDTRARVKWTDVWVPTKQCFAPYWLDVLLYIFQCILSSTITLLRIRTFTNLKKKWLFHHGRSSWRWNALQFKKKKNRDCSFVRSVDFM